VDSKALATPPFDGPVFLFFSLGFAFSAVTVPSRWFGFS
jgi:hypothetical protein